ncbi:arylsulfatase A-like enzyme [Jejuia pallidilutea]|uniref:Arylsulfatase A-like enzyme n=1 Tax=Jejuia pallidilutea TaxID=504487 RepID=A0A362X2Q4_9FLAO|nr:arylsulfatase [Jejuia pallidilutea]PQV50207.1 arylsulfatase A-like enzyme [Jejuia pallidilutea]
MSIKSVLQITLISIVFFACKEKEAKNTTITKPNIIYILADDLGIGDVSIYNENSKIETPNIDALASNGVMYTDAHTSSAVCTPTRYGILTGRYNWRTSLKQGVVSGYSKSLIKPNRTTIADVLKDSGYNTAFIGKWHLGWDWDITQPDSLGIDIDNLKSRPVVDFTKPIKNGPNTHGFDYSYGFCGSLDMPPYVWVENDMPTSVPTKNTKGTGQGFWRKGLTADDFTHEQALPEITNRTVSYINENAKKDDPFFVYMPLPAPHTPILPTDAFKGKSGLENPYADFVIMVDWVVGEVTKALEANGISENTLIVFTSDNGCSPTANFKQLKSKGHNPSYVYRGTKSDIFEGGHCVPYIMTWKNNIQPTKTEQLVCTTDFFATVADILNIDLADNVAEDSFSHLPNSETPKRESIIHHSVRGEFAYRKGDYKVNFCKGSGGWSFPNSNTKKAIYDTLPKVQLYNIKRDAGETKNLQAEHPEIVKEFKAEVLKIINDGRSTTGAKQENDGTDSWPQLDKLKEIEL